MNLGGAGVEGGSGDRGAGTNRSKCAGREPLSPVQSRGARMPRKGAQGSRKAFWETYIFLRAVGGNPKESEAEK